MAFHSTQTGENTDQGRKEKKRNNKGSLTSHPVVPGYRALAYLSPTEIYQQNFAESLWNFVKPS